MQNWSKFARCLVLVALFVGSGATAATFDLLVDRDNNTGTGCTVNTPGGAFAGVEQVFTTAIDTTVFPAKVTGITRTECTTPPSTFSAPFAVDPGGFPVGVGNGTNGFDAVESFITLNQLFGQYRVGAVYNDPNTGSDVLLNVNGQAAAAPIVIGIGPTPVIPTLTHGALLLLAFGLGWLALRQLRRHKASTLVIVGVLASIVAGTALAAVVLDGLINDWAGVPPIATDQTGDAPGGADIAALFVQVEPQTGRMYVRLDVRIAAPPTITSANATTFIVGAAGSFGITTFGIPPVNSILQSGALPAGVNFVYTAGQNTATLSGTPGAGTGGVYPLVFTAKNGVPPDATQNFTLTVNQAPAVTSVNATTFIVGTPGTFTFAASGFPRPTITLTGCAPPLPGGLTFTDNGNGTATLAGSAALGSVGVKNCTVTATNGIGVAATQPFALTINKAPSTTTVSSNNNPSVVGQPVTFTATVVATPPGTGLATGNVQFKDGAADLGAPVALDGTGKATLTTSALTLGAHTITAEYVGDGNFNASTGSLPTQTVSKAGSASTLTSSVNPSVFGQGVTFTATVAATPPGVGTPTGTVQFKDGAANLGAPVALAGGTATFTTSLLSVGAHTITFEYSGDANFGPSTGSLPTQTVNKAATSTAVSSSVNPSVFGQSTTLTATVTATAPGAGTPTGTVQFLDGGNPIGAPVALNGAGVATLAVATLNAGAHTITAPYIGDGNFNASIGSLPTQTVNKAGTTTTLTSSNNPSLPGAPVTFTATLTSIAPGAGTPTGTVTFFDGATTLGTGTLAGGVATFTTSALAPGSHPNINTTYAGDGNFNGSNGGPLNQVVNSGPTAVADPGYSTLHDTLLTVPAATGLLTNDNLGVPAATISAVGAVNCGAFPCVSPTAQGGSVSVNADGSFTFTPKAFFAGNDTFTYTLTNVNGSSTATATIDVQDAAPVVDMNGTTPAGIDFGPVPYNEGSGQAAIVGTALPDLALTITDGDSANIGSATITLTNVQDAGAETLSVTCPGIAPVCSGVIMVADIVSAANAGTYTITITRTAPPADYEALLRTLKYENTSLNPATSPNRLVTVRIDDLIKNNNPLAQATIQVVGVNNTPSITAPNTATTPKDTALAFTGVNAVSVADADSGTGPVVVTLTATNGTISALGSTAGLTNCCPPPAATMTLTGPISNQNTALAGLQFTPTLGYTGAATLKIDIDDQGNTGTGGPKTATKTINITVDTPPSVVSSDPAHNDSNVPTTKLITFTFSEPVNVNANSFSLECPAGVPKAFTVSPAGPATVYTLTPTGGLPAGVICTVAALNNQITDSAGQQLTASHVASFSVNTFPTVQSTVPANGATPVPTGSKITINFTELVTATATAFTLECPVAAAKTFTVVPALPANASSFELTPTVPLPNGTTCTVTVVASQITDGSGQNMAANYVFTFTTGSAPAITSGNATTFIVGTNGSFGVTTTGSPAPAITFTGGLPGGVTLTDNGNGTATLGGTPAAGTGGTYTITINAANGNLPNASQAFTLTVNQLPVAVNDPTAVNVPLYTTPHDTTLSVTAVNGVLFNDSLGFPTATINKVQGTVCAAFPCARTTTQLGSVSVNADGSFTFQPKAAFAGTDTFTYTLINATGESNTATVTLIVTNVNPVVDLDGAAGATIDYAATFTETGGAVPIVDAANLTVTDGDSATLASATIVITNLLDGVSESLAVTLSAPFVAADVVYTPGTGTLQITKSATLLQYQTLLRTLTYMNSSLNPTTTTRDVTVKVNDGIGDNNPLAHSMVTVVAMNTPPSITAPAATLSTPTNTTLSFTGGNTISVADPDAGTGAIKVTLTATNGTVNTTASTGTLTTSGLGTSLATLTGPLTDINTALSGLQFIPTNNFTSPPNATLKIDVDDQGNTGNGGPMTATKTVNILVDSPPTVTMTTPANNATNVSTATTVSITFSEPVNATAASFKFECPVPTAVAFALGGGPTTWTLTQTAPPLPQNTLCTVTVLANQVTDVGAGQNMAANHVLTFTTNSLPTVTSTVPAAGATGQQLSTTVTVNFSEPVNAAVGAFKLECPVGVPAAFSVAPALPAANQSSFVLTPTANLPAGTVCTLTVDATKVTDVTPGQNMAANFTSTFTTGVPPTITSANNVLFTIGQNGSFQVVATGTPSTFTFSESGALPATVTFNTSTGVLSGIPQAGTAGSYPITFGASNGINPDASQAFTLKVCPVITVSLTGQAVPTRTNAYTAQAVGNGGTGPYTFTVLTPPAGTMMSNAGLFSGTVTAAGAYNFQITATDNTGCSGATSFAGQINEPPAVANEAFDVVGNTLFVVHPTTDSGTGPHLYRAVGGVLANDNNGNGGANGAGITVTAGTFATTNGGSITIASNGTFAYTPPVNFTGTDTYVYAVSDGIGTATGTVSFVVATKIWYVKNDAAVGGDGRSTSPFNTLTAAQTASSINETIFIHTGNGTTSGQNSGVLLKNGQRLIGQGAALTAVGTFNTVLDPTLSAAAAGPIIGNSGGDGVSLAQNNTIRGLTVGTTTGAKILGTNFGTLTVGDTATPDVTLSGNGKALDLTTGTFAATSRFVSVSSTNSSTRGISLFFVAGTVALGSTSITSSTAQGIYVSGSTANISFGVTTITTAGAGAEGLRLENNSAGTRTFDTLGISGTTSHGILHTNNGQPNGGGTLTVTGLTTVTNPGGTGLTVQNGSVGAPISFNGFTTSSSAGTGVSISNMQSNISFGDLDINPDNAQKGLVVANSGATIGTISSSSGTVNTTSASAIDIAGSGVAARQALGMTFDVVSSTGGANVSLVNVSGSIAMPAGILTGGTSAFTVSGSSATITYGGSITNTGTGISLTNNTGSTITFSGGMNLSTGANAAFNATGGGTINVTQNNSTIVNTLSTTSGSALNVINTTIGASGLTFRSISSGVGANNGIHLSNTGAVAGLTVSGLDGPDAGTDPDLGSGGTITGKTGPDGSTTAGTGVLLDRVKGVSLNGMIITNHQNHGIRGNEVDGFRLTFSLVGGVNGTNVAAPFNEGSVSFIGTPTTGYGLRGAVAFLDNEITGGRQRNVSIDNATGTMNLNFLRNNVHLTTDPVSPDDGFSLEADTTAVVVANISNNTFAGHKGDDFNLSLLNSAVVDLTFNDNTLSGLGGAPKLSGGIFILGATYNGTFKYDISRNNVQFANQGAAIFVNKGSGTATYSGQIKDNVIGNPVNNHSGSLEAQGIHASARGAGGSHTTLVGGNQVYQYHDRGIVLEAGEGSPGFVATVVDNTVSNFADPVNSLHGIHFDFGILAADNAQITIDVRNNLIANAGNEPQGGVDFRMRTAGSNDVFIVGYVGGNSSANAQAFIDGQNPAGTTFSVSQAATGTYNNGPAGPLPTPNLPTLPPAP